MKITVEHHKTQAEAIQSLDRGVDSLMSASLPKGVEIADVKKTWTGPVMNFSLTGKMGFISVPLAAVATVDDKNVTVELELPALVKNFLGEEKVRTEIEKNVRRAIEA